MTCELTQPGSDAFYKIVNGINDVSRNYLNNQACNPNSIMGINAPNIQIPAISGCNYASQIGGLSPLGGIGMSSSIGFGSMFGGYGMQGPANIQEAIKQDEQLTEYGLQKNDKLLTHQMKPDSDVETVADLVTTGQTGELMGYLKKLSPAEKINLESRYQQKTGKLLRADIRENCDGPYWKAAKAGAAGAAAGAAIGAIGGPPGAILGGVIGAVAGSIAGATGLSLHPFGFSPTDSDLIKELNNKK